MWQVGLKRLNKKYELTANCGLGATSADDGQSAATEVA